MTRLCRCSWETTSLSRGIRLGIEQGDYVYQRGDLLFGPEDPPADIRIDEQAVVMTMVYAKNKGVWPRPKPGPGPTPPGPPGPTPPPGPSMFSAEGVLKDALVQLWEKARSNRSESIAILTIRMFEAGDAFRLLGAVGSVSGAAKVVAFEGGYETRDGGEFELHFRGPVPDAQPVKEFLEPQLRAAASSTVEASFTLTFSPGLSMDGDAAEPPCPLCERCRACLGDAGSESLMGRSGTLMGTVASASVPKYELRVRENGPADSQYEIWQLPAPATPHITAAVRVAGLGGRNLLLI